MLFLWSLIDHNTQDSSTEGIKVTTNYVYILHHCCVSAKQPRYKTFPHDNETVMGGCMSMCDTRTSQTEHVVVEE